MSGLCAIINWDGRPADSQTLERMTAAADHRGPDGIRTWVGGQAAVAHLAHHVTHEDRRERQPTTQGDLVLVADARIDNREELIPALGRHLGDGNPTDAELILAAHRKWGEAAPGHLIGDYAYAVWDRRTQTLHAARDAMAMRALYYHATRHQLLLATEIKQILAVPGVPAELFEPMVAAHLAGPFGAPEWTFYRGIQRLAPGRLLVATPGGHRTRRTWDVDPHHRIRYQHERDYAEHFLELFKSAVEARARTSKPIGIFLSGGMDSGSVASTLGHLRDTGAVPPTAIHAYSWAFEQLEQGDERHVSGGIVSRYGLTPRDVVADELWPLKDYPAHGPDRDAPYIRVYQPLIERTLELARDDGVGTMLVGDRGDEMVGDWIFDHPGLLRSGQLRTLLRELPAHARWAGRPLRWVLRAHLLRPLVADLLGTNGRGGGGRRGWSAVPPYVHRDWARSVGSPEILEFDGPPSALRGTARRMRYGRVFFFGGLRDPVVGERDAARHSLALADPWSDRRIASFVLAVPQWVVQRPSEPKRLARLAMRDIMPEPVLKNAGKVEPHPLFDRGFRDRARATVLELLTGTQLAARGFVDEAALRASFETSLAGGRTRHDIWWPLTLEMWLRRYWA